MSTINWGRLSRSKLSQQSDDSGTLGPLSRLLGRMHLETLTFILPHDPNCKVEGSQRRKRTLLLALSDPWWPAVDLSLMLLLRGKIRILRLAYPEKYTQGEVKDGAQTDPCERFEAIRRLRGLCQDSSAWKFAVRWTSEVDRNGGTVLELTKTSQG